MANDEKQPTAFRIADLAGEDRPREKALAHGIGALTDAELLAIVFGSGLPGQSVLDMSREVLRRSDNDLGKLSRKSMNQLMRDVRGIGPAKAISLYAAFELGCRCQAALSANDDVQIRSSECVYRMMRPQLQRLNHEEFWVLLLNRANRVGSSSQIMSRERISKGGTAATVVDPKIIFKTAIDAQASAIVLVHNHPSGNLHPSAEDDALTRRLSQGAALLDLRILDHIIIAPSGYYSYADNGRL